MQHQSFFGAAQIVDHWESGATKTGFLRRIESALNESKLAFVHSSAVLLSGSNMVFKEIFQIPTMSGQHIALFPHCFRDTDVSEKCPGMARYFVSPPGACLTGVQILWDWLDEWYLEPKPDIGWLEFRTVDAAILQIIEWCDCEFERTTSIDLMKWPKL